MGSTTASISSWICLSRPPINVAVLLGGPGVHLHGLHSAVVLAGEGVEDQVGVLGRGIT